MADKGIIFSAAMVQALLAGRKSQTRRLIKPCTKPTQPGDILISWPADAFIRQGERFRPPYAPGDRLYVREAHRLTDCTCTEACRLPGNVYYEAGGNDDDRYIRNRLRPSIHMPRWASRMTLFVSDVRVQRVQDISEADAQAEGLIQAHEGLAVDRDGRCWGHCARNSFRLLWDSLHTTPGERWADNPWIVAVTFSVVRENIDRIAA